MKRHLYITFVLFAVIIMMVATIMPHHHHGAKLCTVVEYCEHDGKYNDEHTGHHGDHTHCISNYSYIIAKQNVHDHDVNVSLLPLFTLVENLIVFGELYPEDLRPYSCYRQSLYKSADVHRINPLRGPPYLFV